MNLGERIKQLRIRYGMTQEELGEKLGVKKAAVQKYESGTVKNLKKEKIEKLCDIFGVSPSELMNWDEKYDINKIKDELNKIESGVRIPVLGKVAAGIPIEAIENYNTDQWEEITHAMARRFEFFALTIQGNSMEPKFSEGDVVIVRKQDDVQSGDIAVVIVNGSDATVKKVMKQDDGIVLVASNYTVYPPTFYDNEKIETLPVKILGKVVELRSKF